MGVPRRPWEAHKISPRAHSGTASGAPRGNAAEKSRRVAHPQPPLPIGDAKAGCLDQGRVATRFVTTCSRAP
eukprot:9484552-Pyramimonas_sp.AAC.3